MLHTELSHLAVGLPPSILAAAVGRAARLAGISVTDLLAVDAAHEKATIVIAALEKVQAQYGRKKAASRDRRSAARKAAPAVGPSVASLTQVTSQISMVGAEYFLLALIKTDFSEWVDSLQLIKAQVVLASMPVLD